MGKLNGPSPRIRPLAFECRHYQGSPPSYLFWTSARYVFEWRLSLSLLRLSGLNPFGNFLLFVKIETAMVAFLSEMINLKLPPFKRVFRKPQVEGLPMAENISKKESICFERCYFEAKNCKQNDDGTWDCSSSPRFCEEHCCNQQ